MVVISIRVGKKRVQVVRATLSKVNWVSVSKAIAKMKNIELSVVCAIYAKIYIL